MPLLADLTYDVGYEEGFVFSLSATGVYEELYTMSKRSRDAHLLVNKPSFSPPRPSAPPPGVGHPETRGGLGILTK